MTTGSPTCPVCGGDAWSAPLRGTRLRCCPGCGTALHDRSASRDEEESRYHRCLALPQRDAERVAREQWEWLATRFPSSGPLRVLDVGCGGGEFLACARAAGAAVQGIELDPAAAERCRAAGIPVLQGSLFDVPIPPGPWDRITLWDVLDHLERPDAALALLVPTLAVDGLLVVRGRNGAVHVRARRMLARLPGLAARLPELAVVHRWGFSPAGWRRLLEAAGLRATLHPGLPTAGDRYASGPVARILKGGVRAGAGIGFRLTGGRSYLYPSVLLTANRPASEQFSETMSGTTTSIMGGP